MEVLIIAGLLAFAGGVVLMGLSLVVGIFTWAVALVVVVVQSLWRAVAR